MPGKVGVGVAVFIIRDDGKFLMAKRQGAHGEGSWSVPGGWLEIGEDWENAAIRETAEETGLIINHPITNFATTNDYFEKENVHSNTIWLKTKFLGGNPQILEPEKCTEQGWFDINSLPEPLFLPWKNLLKQKLDLSI